MLAIIGYVLGAGALIVGIKNLALARPGEGWHFHTETCALDKDFRTFDVSARLIGSATAYEVEMRSWPESAVLVQRRPRIDCDSTPFSAVVRVPTGQSSGVFVGVVYTQFWSGRPIERAERTNLSGDRYERYRWKWWSYAPFIRPRGCWRLIKPERDSRRYEIESGGSPPDGSGAG